MYLTAVQRTARKDTAAYASLPLSTMSKSTSQQRLERTPGTPAALAGHPEPEAFPGSSSSRTAPSMKMFYLNPFRRSTPFSKIFSKSASSRAIIR
jgi:hypothetical protein